MRSNNLLAILSNNQSNRGRSVTGKHGLSPTFSFLPRSNSTSLQKYQPKSNPPQQMSQLVKVVHLLNVKVKQIFYFSFCRLEQLSITESKKHMKAKTDITTKIQEVESQDICSVVQEQSSSTKFQRGIQKMTEFETAVSGKIQMRQESTLINSSFQTMRRNYSKSKSTQKIQTILNEKISNSGRKFLKGLKLIEKQKIRGQIVMENIQQVIARHEVMAFISLKLWKPEIKLQEVIKESSSEVDTPHFEALSPQKHEILKDIQQSDVIHEISLQDLNEECKKMPIKLKQKKTASARPINLKLFSKLKSVKTITTEDTPLYISDNIRSQPQNEQMKRFINQKPQNFITCLPDFTDNCNLFREVPNQSCQTFGSVNHTSTNSAYFTEQVQSFNQFLPQEECVTDRTKEDKAERSTSKQFKTPAYNKHKSVGSFNQKKPINDSTSPLMRVQQLLKNMRNMQNKKSIQKEKRLVNISIPRQLYECTPAKLQAKVSNNKCDRSLNKYRSADKENIADRMVTEKAKNGCEKGGLETQKVKSTILTKEKRGKMQKNQVFTARKMKLEIENIINRRNRQLRSQVRPIK